MTVGAAVGAAPAAAEVPLLAVRALCKRFGGLVAVADLDFDVRPGEILGMIGPNGAGKSTTFAMVAGALAASSGSVRFREEDITGLRPHEIASRGIMRTFQHNKLFAGMSVRDNVLVGMHVRLAGSALHLLAATAGSRRKEREARRRADELIESVGLQAQRHANVATLSFGQGRLLEVARALAGEPQLVLFDEPAAGLTPAESERLADIVRRMAARGISVLLIEHDMHFLLALVHRVVVLNFGRKIAEGTPQAICRDPAVVQAYLGEPLTPGVT